MGAHVAQGAADIWACDTDCRRWFVIAPFGHLLRMDNVELSAKLIRNPKSKDMDMLLSGLGEDLSKESALDALRSNNMSSLLPDFKDEAAEGEQEFGPKSFLQTRYAAIASSSTANAAEAAVADALAVAMAM